MNRGARLTDALGLTLPLVQAGMGGVAGPALAAAVSTAGAGGVLALYKEAPERIGDLVGAVAGATSLPFGVNVIPEVVGAAVARAQVHAAVPRLPRAGFVTFFGLPDRATAAAATGAGHRLVVQVGTLRDASAALDLGADVLVVQGVEAGGHLLGELPARRLVDEVRARHPGAVLAVAGGVGCGGDLARALAAGADGAMAGTLFVPTLESLAHPAFQARVVAAHASDTVVTSLFDIGWPGRRHRVLRNALTDAELAGAGRSAASFIATVAVGGRSLPVPRYSATVPSVRVDGRIDEMAMYCGCSCARVTAAEPVAAVLARFRRDFEVALAHTEVA